MRIISGVRKGQKLIGPKNYSKIRPTSDCVKEFIFNFLGNVVIKTKVLDLFSGTGNLGIEALSRGALEVIFVERNKHISQIILENLKITQFESQSKVINRDVFRCIKWLTDKNQKFDLIFADPPYQGNLYYKLLKSIDEHNLLLKNGILIFEHQSNESSTNSLTNLLLYKTRKLGNTTVSFFIQRGGKN